MSNNYIGSVRTTNIGNGTINVNSSTTLTMSHAAVYSGTNYSVQFNNQNSNKGSFRFDTNNGNIEVHDGQDWVVVAGLSDSQTILDKVVQTLKEDYPEVLADLVLRGTIE